MAEDVKGGLTCSTLKINTDGVAVLDHRDYLHLKYICSPTIKLARALNYGRV